jgi:Holliday junction resolvase RusA-like endonuclease
MTRLVFDVAGTPVPQGSAKAFNRKGGGPPIVTHDAKGLHAWRNDIAKAARDAKAGDTTLLMGPVGLRITFRLTRPASHYGTRGNLLPSAPAYPMTRPDLDKLVRAAKDAMKGVVYRDDGQVCWMLPEKVYAELGHQPGAHIEVGLLRPRVFARNDAPAPVGLGL